MRAIRHKACEKCAYAVSARQHLATEANPAGELAADVDLVLGINRDVIGEIGEAVRGAPTHRALIGEAPGPAVGAFCRETREHNAAQAGARERPSAEVDRSIEPAGDIDIVISARCDTVG